jgi:hypothetical protein
MVQEFAIARRAKGFARLSAFVSGRLRSSPDAALSTELVPRRTISKPEADRQNRIVILGMKVCRGDPTPLPDREGHPPQKGSRPMTMIGSHVLFHAVTLAFVKTWMSVMRMNDDFVPWPFSLPEPSGFNPGPDPE